MTFSLKPGWPWRSLWSILGSGWAFTTGNDILARCVVALHSLWDHAVSLFFCSFSLFFSKSNHSCILYRPQLTEINLRFVSIVGEECDEFQGNLLHLSFANFETACLKPVKPCSTFFFLHGLDALTKAANLVCATLHLNEDIAATEDDIQKFAKKGSFWQRKSFYFGWDAGHQCFPLPAEWWWQWRSPCEETQVSIQPRCSVWSELRYQNVWFCLIVALKTR